jgi:hypothetical protein
MLINFAMSCIMGISVDSSFRGMVTDFLNYSIGLIPFKYLSLSTGAKSMRHFTWQALMDPLVTRLSLRCNRFIG